MVGMELSFLRGNIINFRGNTLTSVTSKAIVGIYLMIKMSH